MAEEKLDFKKILPVFVIVLIDLLGLTIIIPLLPLYSVAFGATPLMYGVLGTAYPLMQFIGAPVLGRLSDRFGRKPVLIVSQIGTMIGFIILGFSNSLWMLFAARIIDGISGANISTAQAVITDSTTEKTRTQGLGLIGAAFGLGFIIGPIISFAALALSGNNYAVPAFLAAGFSLTSILMTIFWLAETNPAERRAQMAEEGSARKGFSFGVLFEAMRRPNVGILLGLMFAQQLAFGGFELLLALFTLSRLGMNARDNSGLFVFVGVIVVAVQGYFVGKWSQRLGDRNLIYLGLGALAAGLMLTALTPSVPVPWYSEARIHEELASGADLRTRDLSINMALPFEADRGWVGLAWILVAMIPASIGGGILQPSINSLITKRVDASEVGGMLGLSTSLYSGGNAIAPLVGGALFSGLGSTAPFFGGGLLLAALLIASLQLLQPGQEEEARPGVARGVGAAE